MASRTTAQHFADKYSLADFYGSGSDARYTAPVTQAIPAVTLGQITADFIAGQGVRINHAGAQQTFGAASGLAGNYIGTAGGTTRYYCVAPFDDAGGVDACSSISSVASTASTLVSPTPYAAGNQVSLSWTAPASGTAPSGYAIYSGLSAAQMTLIGVSYSANWTDFGSSWLQSSNGDWVPFVIPDWLANPTGTNPVVSGGPAFNAPFSAPQPDWLVTTISMVGTAMSGGLAYPSLTLAAAPQVTNTTPLAVLHDDTAAVTAMSASVGYVNATPGTYHLSSAPALVAPKGEHVIGAGTNLTILSADYPSGDAFGFGFGLQQFDLVMAHFSMVQAARTHGALIHVGGVSNFLAYDFHTRGGADVLAVDDLNGWQAQATFRDFVAEWAQNSGLVVGAQSTAGQQPNGVVVENALLAEVRDNGLQYYYADGVYMHDASVYQAGTAALTFSPQTYALVSELTCDACTLDSTKVGYGVALTAQAADAYGATGAIGDVDIINSRINSNSLHGVYVGQGPRISGVRLDGNSIHLNGQDGIVATNVNPNGGYPSASLPLSSIPYLGLGLSITHNLIGFNGQSGSGHYGVAFGAGVAGVQAIANRIGRVGFLATTQTSPQACGIYNASTIDTFISLNWMPGNVTSGVCGTTMITSGFIGNND